LFAAGAAFGGVPGRKSGFASDGRVELPLGVAFMLDVAACLRLGEVMCAGGPGGLREPAGAFGWECDRGLRDRLKDDGRGE
jgi:hypothetical protein